MEWWMPVLTALAGFAVATIAAITPAVQRLLLHWIDPRERRERRYLHGLEQITHLYSFFKNINSIAKVDRVILFTGHNCGGVPKPGSPYWVRAIYGHTLHKDKDPLVMYGYDVPIDLAYVEMLLDLMKNGKYTFRPETHKECRLKALYEMEGVKESKIFYLGLFDNRLLYMTVATYQDAPFTPKEEMEIQLLVERVRAFYDEAYS